MPNVSTITDTGRSDTDGVGHLDLATLRRTGGDDVLGHPASGVGGRAVDLRRVLAREGTAAVAGHAAVGVDDDLAAGEPAVGVGAAELERAGRVDPHVVAVLGELRRHERMDHVLDEVGLDERLRIEPGACCVEISTVFRRTGRPSS